MTSTLTGLATRPFICYATRIEDGHIVVDITRLAPNPQDNVEAFAKPKAKADVQRCSTIAF